jgi:hypothetical protein
VAERQQIGRTDRVAIVLLGHCDDSVDVQSSHLVALADPDEAALRLYDELHRCDTLGLSAILIVMPPDTPEWLAVRDRVLRATQPMAARHDSLP